MEAVQTGQGREEVVWTVWVVDTEHAPGPDSREGALPCSRSWAQSMPLGYRALSLEKHVHAFWNPDCLYLPISLAILGACFSNLPQPLVLNHLIAVAQGKNNYYY